MNLIFIFIILILVLSFTLKESESFNSYSYQLDTDDVTENIEKGANYSMDLIVAHNDNSKVVDITPINASSKLDNVLVRAFTKLESQETGTPFTTPLGYKRVSVDEKDVNKVLSEIISKVNKISGKKFKSLDLQSFKKEFNGIHSLFTINLFLIEDSSKKWNDYTKNVSIIAKYAGSNLISIPYIRLIGKSSGSINPFNSGNDTYHIQNSLHLSAPYLTNEQPILPNQFKTENLVRDYNKGIQKVESKCFKSSEKAYLTDIDSRASCDQIGGTWDSPPKSDYDCPFYKSNKNYNNHRGGISSHDKTRCEVPLGVKLMGYRNPIEDEINKPWCYNCKKGADGSPNSIGQCCEEQKNRIMYPNLLSPDYAFKDDDINRYHAKKDIKSKGLEVIRYPGNRYENKNISYFQKQTQNIFNKLIGN